MSADPLCLSGEVSARPPRGAGSHPTERPRGGRWDRAEDEEARPARGMFDLDFVQKIGGGWRDSGGSSEGAL